MPPLITERTYIQKTKCYHCNKDHAKACSHPRHLANARFECGCDQQIVNVQQGKNHCCVCKKSVKLHKAEWHKTNKAMLRCWTCKLDAEKQIKDQQDQQLMTQESHDQKMLKQSYASVVTQELKKNKDIDQ